jgi:uncharacterized protein YndB with AHSA1/START domain
MNRTLGNRHGSAVITLPSDNQLVITRQFDAPAALVFRALTTPELVQRWWGFEGDEWLVCEIDLRVGGAWRFVARHNDFEVGFHGEYREIAAPHRLVHTEIYEGAPEPYPNEVAVNTTTLAESGGVTTMTILVQLPSQEVRDAILASGMEGGMQVSYNRLEDLVREQAAA